MNDNFFAVLPHGVRLEGWSEEEKLEMNDYVRHMLHSKRSKFRRSMKGFGLYVRKREFCILFVYIAIADAFSSWIFRDIIRHFDHAFRSRLGTIFNR